MPIVEWDDCYSVRNDLIDQQHRQLFQAVNDLYDAVYTNKGDGSSVQKALDFLVGYTISHFRDEEELMRARKYPDLASHQLEHKALIDILERFDSRLRRIVSPDRTSKELEEALVAFLTGEWLLKHVVVVDRQYISYLTDSG